MRTFFFVIVLIGAGYWLAIRLSGSKTPTQVVRDEIHSAVDGAVSNVVDRFEPEKLKAQLAESGEAIRSQAVEIGHQVAAGTEDARITATIKARLAKDDPATALGISVSTTAGLVTLSGSAKTFEQVTNSIYKAMSVDGVVNVFSTLQVRP